MAELLGFDSNSNYERKTQALKSNGIALWDVLEKCDRDGAADANIQNPVATDFKSFYLRHPKINRVFFNGHKAENLYFHLVPFAEIQGDYLPSTSPANAAIPFERKLEAWLSVIN